MKKGQFRLCTLHRLQTQSKIQFKNMKIIGNRPNATTEVKFPVQCSVQNASIFYRNASVKHNFRDAFCNKVAKLHSCTFGPLRFRKELRTSTERGGRSVSSPASYLGSNADRTPPETDYPDRGFS